MRISHYTVPAIQNVIVILEIYASPFRIFIYFFSGVTTIIATIRSVPHIH